MSWIARLVLPVVLVCLAASGETKYRVRMSEGDKIFSVEIICGDSGTARRLAKEQHPKASILDVKEVKEEKPKDKK